MKRRFRILSTTVALGLFAATTGSALAADAAGFVSPEPVTPTPSIDRDAVTARFAATVAAPVAPGTRTFRPEGALAPPRVSRAAGFVDRHLVPGLVRALDRERSFHSAFSDGHELRGHAMFEYWVDRTGRRAERGTVRAFKAYLLEETGLEQAVDAWFDRRRGAAAGPGAEGADGADAIDYRLGLSGGLPEVSMTRRLDAGDVKLSFGLRGRASVVLGHDRLRGVRLGAHYDADDDRVGLDLRLFF